MPETATAPADTPAPAHLQSATSDAATVGTLGFAPGHLFAGRFRIAGLLGRGATGQVYRADDLRLGQPVALKVLTRDGLDPHVVPNFTWEARLSRTITHPNICRVFDVGEADGWHYLSMEYVDGETLASTCCRLGRLPPEKANDVAQQLCAGLAAAHGQRVVHGDLKPANIMLDGRGRVRIMDFGVATLAGAPAARLAGTPAYVSPEQLRGGPATERSDLFSLGLVLYEIVTGRRALDAASFLDRVASEVNLGGLSLPPDCDPRLAAVIRSCLADDPARRPATALHVAAALPGGDAIATALAEGRIPAPEIVAAAPAGRPLGRTAAASLLMLVVTGLAVIGWQGDALTIRSGGLTKPPDALAERARQLLELIGGGASQDEAFWFETVNGDRTIGTVRFVLRVSPAPLVPSNLLRRVTRTDPPNDVDGMATVTLDAAGHLISFSRVTGRPGVTRSVSWPDLFREAGLDFASFAPTALEHRPLLPHDEALSWTSHDRLARPQRVTAATLAQAAVAFDADPAPSSARPPDVLSTRRAGVSDGALSVLVLLTFVATSVMVRRHLRRGEGDRRSAMVVGTVVVVGGVMSASLQAHHVPDAGQEMLSLLSITGWCLLWGAFSWLAYLAFEPQVRRLWPRTLSTWTRALANGPIDPLVGRDMLAGIVAGVALALLSLGLVLVGQRSPRDAALLLMLQSLQSPRFFMSRLLFLALDSIQFALGGLFILVLLRALLGRTWLAVAVLVLINLPLTAWNPSPAAIGYAVLTAALFVAIVLQLGLLAAVAMLVTYRVLTSLPVVLDFGAWYVTTSAVVLFLVLALAVGAFRLARRRRPSAATG